MELGRKNEPAFRVPIPVRWVALVAAVAAALGVWVWQRNSEGRAIARMAPERRAVLYRAVRQEATVLCGSEGLTDRCRTQVELLALFPECDADCQHFVAEHRPRPVR